MSPAPERKEAEDTELAELTARIEEVRAAIDELRAERALVEKTKAPSPHEIANQELRAKIAAARERLAALEEASKETDRLRAENASRSRQAFVGLLLILTGLVPLAGGLWRLFAHPEEGRIDTTVFGFLTLIAVFGLGLVVESWFRKVTP